MMGLNNNFVLTSKIISNFEIVLQSYLVWVGHHKNLLLSNIDQK